MALQSKEDKFISAVNLQLKLLQTYTLNAERNADISKAFRTCFLVILAVRIKENSTVLILSKFSFSRYP